MYPESDGVLYVYKPDEYDEYGERPVPVTGLT